MDQEARIAEHSQRYSRGILRRHSVRMDVKKREMACADKLHQTIWSSSPYNKGRKLSGKSALAENAVGVLHHPIEGEAGLGEPAKCGVKVTHEHRRGHAFAGDIPQHE